MLQSGGVNVGAMCGYNTGQHIYIHLPRKIDRRDTNEEDDDDMEYDDDLEDMDDVDRDRDVKILLDFDGDENYVYNIKVTQVCI